MDTGPKSLPISAHIRLSYLTACLSACQMIRYDLSGSVRGDRIKGKQEENG